MHVCYLYLFGFFFFGVFCSVCLFVVVVVFFLIKWLLCAYVVYFPVFSSFRAKMAPWRPSPWRRNKFLFAKSAGACRRCRPIHIDLESAIYLVCDLRPTDVYPSSVLCGKCRSSLGNRICRFTTSMRAGRFRGRGLVRLIFYHLISLKNRWKY